MHPWAARVAAAAARGRAPLGELRGGFREASQVSRERQETDPIDFSLLQDLEHSRSAFFVLCPPQHCIVLTLAQLSRSRTT